LRERSLSCKEGVRALALAASQRFAQLDQTKPAEVDKHVAILELLSEKVLAAMEEKDNEAKRARTVRYEYHRDVEQVQSWICQAEGRVQDRNLEPQTLKDFLQVRIEFAKKKKKLKKRKKIQNRYLIVHYFLEMRFKKIKIAGTSMRNWFNYRSNGPGFSTRPTDLSAHTRRTRATVGADHVV
jgi:hypothetical protein